MTRGLGREGGHRRPRRRRPKTNSSGSSTALSRGACLSEPVPEFFEACTAPGIARGDQGAQQWTVRRNAVLAPRVCEARPNPQHRRSRSPCEAGPDQSRTASIAAARRRIRREGHRERHASDPARLPRRSRHGRGLPRETIAPPTPVPNRQHRHVADFATAPNRNSAQPAAFASLSIVMSRSRRSSGGPERLVAPADVGRV